MNNANNSTCFHIGQVDVNIKGNTKGCEECEKIGHVGCCDSSVNKHGTKHYQETDHPVIKSYEPGENWKWCYEDNLFIE